MQKKVLFIATVNSHIELFHTHFLELFKKEGWKTFIATGEKEKLKNSNFCDEKIQVSIDRFPFSFKNLKAIKELTGIIKKEKFNIIHCHTPVAAVITRLAAITARKKYGTRVIYTAHGFCFYIGAPLLHWLFFYPIEWFLSKYTDVLITMNDEDYKRAKEKFGKRCKDIKYVKGVGVELKKYKKRQFYILKVLCQERWIKN